LIFKFFENKFEKKNEKSGCDHNGLNSDFWNIFCEHKIFLIFNEKYLGTFYVIII
jgi:hypothetical protein